MIAARAEGVEQDPRPDDPITALRPMNPAVEAALTKNYHAFSRFLARRLTNESAAEDVLQTFCLRAVNRGAELRQSESAVAWLYNVLRSVLTDHYRSEAARQRLEANYAQEQLILGDGPEETRSDENICNCFRDLMPTLRPEYELVLRLVDLSGERREKVAADLGITAANVRVRLHRARQALRKAVENCCGNCFEHCFRDCTCQAPTNSTSLTTHDREVEWLTQHLGSERPVTENRETP